MDYDDPLQREYTQEIEAAYRGWFFGLTPHFTARLFEIELQFAVNVYAALDRRWPAMAARVLYEPTTTRPSYVPDITNDPD